MKEKTHTKNLFKLGFLVRVPNHSASEPHTRYEVSYRKQIAYQHSSESSRMMMRSECLKTSWPITLHT